MRLSAWREEDNNNNLLNNLNMIKYSLVMRGEPRHPERPKPPGTSEAGFRLGTVYQNPLAGRSGTAHQSPRVRLQHGRLHRHYEDAGGSYRKVAEGRLSGGTG